MEGRATVDGNIGSEQSSYVQQLLVEHAERQTQLLQQIADRLRFFYVLVWVGLGLLALYTIGAFLWTYAST